MAEIHVERKTKKPIWPWVLILVILLLVALGWWFFRDTPVDEIPDEVEINSIEQTSPDNALVYDANHILFFNS
ncbi:hypothetical protein [Catalinimonas niigatensis]|uniref:hypothetical protein n=1 Tax=Catalinimonas niigatensis TaxID=1397264 RepID=UPI0026657483|nr:hypothetical protein [Catalinimonas niigatensis]WPP48992.1 hypothetical protein PZB72_20195 [Catalinimonas niigatensis]